MVNVVGDRGDNWLGHWKAQPYERLPRHTLDPQGDVISLLRVLAVSLVPLYSQPAL